MNKRNWKVVLLVIVLFVIDINGNYGQTKFTLEQLQGAQNNVSSGSLSLKIPLYTLEVGDMKIPIYLTYDGTGVKLSDQSSCVGLKWKLHAGGEIRQVSMGGRLKGRSDYVYNASPRSSGPRRSRNPNIKVEGTTIPGGKFKPNVFRYSIPYESGVFLEPTPGALFRQGKLNTSIKRCNADDETKEKAYEIIDDKGNIYTFNMGKSVYQSGFHIDYDADSFVDAFPLKTIVTKSGENIDFSYVYDLDRNAFLTDEIRTEILEQEYSYYNVQKIKALTKEIVFNYTILSSQGSSEKFLKEILIKNNNSVERKYIFEYDERDIDPYRKLKSIYLAGNENVKKLYGFTYNESPRDNFYKEPIKEYNKKNGYQQDFYGYYNNNEQESLCPFKIPRKSKGKANRFFSMEEIQTDILKEVTLPLGGKLVYNYKPKWDGEYYGGGLVVSEIKEYSKNSLLKKTKYRYGNLVGFCAPNTQEELDRYKNDFVFQYKEWYAGRGSVEVFPERNLSITLTPGQAKVIEGATSGNFFTYILKEEYDRGEKIGEEKTYYTYSKSGYSYYGIPKKIESFDAKGQLLRKIEMEYNWRNSNYTHPYIAKRVYRFVISSGWKFNYKYHQEYLGLGYPLLKRKQNFNYRRGNSICKIEEYNYTEKDQIRSIHNKSDRVSISYRKNIYPYDFKPIGSIRSIYNWGGDHWIKKMYDKHVYQPIVIAQGDNYNSYFNSNIIKYNSDNYKVEQLYENKSFISYSELPSNQIDNFSTSGYQLKKEMLYDKNNNLCEINDKNDGCTSRLFFNNDLLAVVVGAKLYDIGYNSFESSTMDNWGGDLNRVIDNAFTGKYSAQLSNRPLTFRSPIATHSLKRIKIEFWGKSVNHTSSRGNFRLDVRLKNGQTGSSINRVFTTEKCWKKYQFNICLSNNGKLNFESILYSFFGTNILIDELRISPYDAAMQTLGYDEKGRLIYKCNTLVNPIHYYYNEFDQVTDIKDEEGNVLQKKVYKMEGVFNSNILDK